MELGKFFLVEEILAYSISGSIREMGFRRLAAHRSLLFCTRRGKWRFDNNVLMMHPFKNGFRIESRRCFCLSRAIVTCSFSIWNLSISSLRCLSGKSACHVPMCDQSVVWDATPGDRRSNPVFGEVCTSIYSPLIVNRVLRHIVYVRLCLTYLTNACSMEWESFSHLAHKACILQ